MNPVRRLRLAWLIRSGEWVSPKVPTLDPLEAWDLARRGEACFVDVRGPEERAVSTIPGALPPEELTEELRETRQCIAYCTVGVRSARWAHEHRAVNLRGSLLAWTFAGLPLEDAQGRATRRVHTYGPRWAVVAAGYEAVW